ncbi:hypothetical protein ASZ78_010722 [Callipepla squamata]|uniref:Calpain catalytic domain-containing protein n=1 Tax=Callipepla squamata TaxID=9009 RepID=A0A226NJ04_CALSU|nr:hypothetical protein ASZ78_010722 [Callipepla squamata]
MASKGSKKKELGSRNSSGMLGAKDVPIYRVGASRFPIWPEWNDTDISAEKWDFGKVGKEKEKAGRSPVSTPVVVKNEISCDLFAANEHLFCSELMRWIVSEICALWRIYNEKASSIGTSTLFWKPWEHIYPSSKNAKGHMPLYNSYGKYVVKLYWMGCWRKITVDDTMPFSEEGNLLLPATTCQTELWPMLLSKAIIKLANTRLGYLDKIWDILKKIVPEFNWTDESTPLTGTKPKETKVSEIKIEISPVNEQPDKPEKAEKSDKEKAEQKEIGKKKNRDGEKEKSKAALHPSEASTEVQLSPQSLAESSSMPTQPEMAVCAGCMPLHLSEEKFFSLTQMTDSSEKLRQYGFSHVYSHPVLVTRIRSCALEAPEQPIAPWKLFRQKKTVAKSEPQEPVLEKPEQYVEIASLFLNYKFNPIEIPNNMNLYVFHKPHSYAYSYQKTDFKESYRFIVQATTILKAIGKVFNSAFWFLIKYVLDKKIPHRYKFAFRSFTLDFKYSDVFEDDSVSSGTKENANVKEILQKLWAAVELNFEQCAVVLLREIFFVPEDMFLVPRMYTTIPSCRLHVIDNDTLEEMPRVFLKMAPHIYPKNKKGYTFMAEAHTGDQALAAGRWRLRLISSRSPLPFLSREAVNNIYSTKEIKEYYIPNDKCVMFRYSVKVTASHIATVQVQTSNSDVFIKLQVLDNEEEIVNVTGKGHAVIPAFNFLSNETLLCSFLSKSQVVRGIGKKESETRFKRRGRVSAPKDTRSSFKRGLSQESLSVLEEAAFPSENLESNQESPQQQDAINKPYWTLRLVSEQREMENLELKRDTQRADEIKAMKRAWESAEPGRAVKAFQERMKFINKYVERDSKEPIAGMDTASSSSKSEERGSFSHTTEMTASLTAIDSSLPTQQKKWEPVDLSPYMRKTMSESVLRNESIIQEQEKCKMEKVNNFRQLRDLALEQREMEQHARTLLKQNMLDMYDNLQASLDEKRGRVHSIREAYRSKLLKAELRKLEELAAHEAMLQTEQEKKSQDAHKKKQGKGLGKRM